MSDDSTSYPHLVIPRLPRDAIRWLVPCPRCHAAYGMPCEGKRGPRIAIHQSRRIMARAAQVKAAYSCQ